MLFSVRVRACSHWKLGRTHFSSNVWSSLPWMSVYKYVGISGSSPLPIWDNVPTMLHVFHTTSLHLDYLHEVYSFDPGSSSHRWCRVEPTYFAFPPWKYVGSTRAVASLTVPGGQDFHFPYSFLKFQSYFLIFLTLFSFCSSFCPPGKALPTPLGST